MISPLGGCEGEVVVLRGLQTRMFPTEVMCYSDCRVRLHLQAVLYSLTIACLSLKLILALLPWPRVILMRWKAKIWWCP